MELNCIHCGHRFALDAAYRNYEGLVRCNTCHGLLDVKLEDGMVCRVAFARTPTAQAPQSESAPAEPSREAA